MNFELRHHFSFEAARKLDHLPVTHPCANLHGHSFKVTAVIVGEKMPGIEWVADYSEIKKICEAPIAELDHADLNKVLAKPTTENIALWLYEKIKKDLPSLRQIIICETDVTECRYPAL